MAFTLGPHPHWYSLPTQHFVKDVHKLESIPRLVVIGIIRQMRAGLGELAEGAGVV